MDYNWIIFLGLIIFLAVIFNLNKHQRKGGGTGGSCAGGGCSGASGCSGGSSGCGGGGGCGGCGG